MLKLVKIDYAKIDICCVILILCFSIMKNVVSHSGRYRFPVKLVCCIAFGSASSACFSHKSIYSYHYIVLVVIIIM